ncbi:uncharacterized protein JCM10292_004357 [Rhodotorula paludigena]|uniref:uncharacterized protein n=1 Tax=Rhodotorula paludigena TaxID=86838 RepID=UPI003178DF10
MRLLRLLLLLPLLLPVFPPVRGGEADVAIAITAPGSITVGEKVQFAWDTGKAPYTIRILIDSSEVKKVTDVKKTTFSWVAKDKVQIWVHASDEISGKTPQIRVQAAGEGDDVGGGDNKKATATKSKGDGDIATAGTEPVQTPAPATAPTGYRF